ncbi:MAG: hypothetical protein JXR70_11765 [Spirochaetales bacterium]|nr:hypothetical protein [Spirochaetales bacterium]
MPAKPGNGNSKYETSLKLFKTMAFSFGAKNGFYQELLFLGFQAGLSGTSAFACEGFRPENIRPETLWQGIFEKMPCHTSYP